MSEVDPGDKSCTQVSFVTEEKSKGESSEAVTTDVAMYIIDRPPLLKWAAVSKHNSD
jgi:hypothetical protein